MCMNDPPKKDPIPSVIKSATKMLADNIERLLPFELWDEATELLHNELRKRADKKHKIPASVLYDAELKHKMELNEQNSRYCAGVNG